MYEILSESDEKFKVEQGKGPLRVNDIVWLVQCIYGSDRPPNNIHPPWRAIVLEVNEWSIKVCPENYSNYHINLVDGELFLTKEDADKHYIKLLEHRKQFYLNKAEETQRIIDQYRGMK